ncbi:MAG: hypothetical protein RBR09_10845 [Desulfobulbaceae bacterium]|nr:hypothetical protein [Desulfobulbaceae bacterium]MDY0351741.1 hypothetical protein [Desulfobulbaceae bacterium]
MLHFFRKKKCADAKKKLIAAAYGDSPPLRRVDREEAITIAADEILLGMVDRQEVQRQAKILFPGPVPCSTHDLALSVAASFFHHPDYATLLKDFHLLALVQAIQWFRHGLVAAAQVENFARVLRQLNNLDP